MAKTATRADMLRACELAERGKQGHLSSVERHELLRLADKLFTKNATDIIYAFDAQLRFVLDQLKVLGES